MYDIIDRPVALLDFPGRLLVPAMRQWVAARLLGRCCCGILGTAFAENRAGPVLPDFHMMMAVLNGDGIRRFVFGSACHPLVTEDEALVLALVHAAMHDRGAVVRDTAARLIAPHMAPVFARAVARLADGLAAPAAADRHRGTAA